jgi:hypothetical protein
MPTAWSTGGNSGGGCIQDLKACDGELRADPLFAEAHVVSKLSRVEDFEIVMAVVLMILLYPNVHQFSEAQQREVIEWV